MRLMMMARLVSGIKALSVWGQQLELAATPNASQPTCLVPVVKDQDLAS